MGRRHTGVRSSRPLLSFLQLCSLYMCLYMYLIRDEYCERQDETSFISLLLPLDPLSIRLRLSFHVKLHLETGQYWHHRYIQRRSLRTWLQRPKIHSMAYLLANANSLRPNSLPNHSLHPSPYPPPHPHLLDLQPHLHPYHMLFSYFYPS